MATKKPSKADKIDLEMMMGLIGNALLSESGIEQIAGLSSQAQDPTGLVANVVLQAVARAREKVESKGMALSPKIWTARGGVIDRTVAEVAKLAAAVTENPQFVNPQILEETRKQVVEMLGGGQPTEQATDEMVDAEYQEVMPMGEAGGSHGPNRMPGPGLLGGMQ